MRLGLDLDGTTHHAKPGLLSTINKVLERHGYSPVSEERYAEVFQTEDWKQLYRDFGAREEDVDTLISSFIGEYDAVEPPELIPGAKETLALAERIIGQENIYFVTQEPVHRVEMRFQRDGWSHYFPHNVRSAFEGKAEDLHKLALQQPERPFLYVGDTVSDGRAVLASREMGASNLEFCGILHQPYAMNRPEDMMRFVAEHQDFADVVNDLAEFNRMLRRGRIR